MIGIYIIYAIYAATITLCLRTLKVRYWWACLPIAATGPCLAWMSTIPGLEALRLATIGIGIAAAFFFVAPFICIYLGAKIYLSGRH